MVRDFRFPRPFGGPEWMLVVRSMLPNIPCPTCQTVGFLEIDHNELMPGALDFTCPCGMNVLVTDSKLFGG